MAEYPTVFDIREILRQKIDQDVASFESNVKVVKAITLGVDNSTSPVVSGKAKYVWVREHGLNGAVHQAFNPDKIPLVVNLPILLMYSPKEPFRWEVYGSDWAEVYHLTGFVDQNFGVGAHSPNQEWPDYAAGYDPLSVYPRSLYPLRTYPSTGLLISISSHRYVYNGEVKTFYGIEDIDLSSHQPVSGVARLVVVYLDKVSNVINTVAGSVRMDGAVLPDYPSIPGESIVSAAVRLDGDQTVIAEVDITDLRMDLTDTEALGLLKSIAAAETEIDYTLSNHELRIDEINVDSIVDSIEDLYALPLTMNLIMALPALRGFWPGSVQASPTSGNYNLVDISGNGQHFIHNNNPTVDFDTTRLFPYVEFNGSDEWYSIADTAHWDILGTEAGVAAARRGLTVAAWVYFNNTASATEYILTKREGTNKSFYLYRNLLGYPIMQISSTGSDEFAKTGSLTIPSGEWHLLVGRFSPSSELAVFDNGIWYRNTTSIPSSIFNGTADLFMSGRDDPITPGRLLMDGRNSLAWICAANVPDAAIDRLWNTSRKIFGV